MNIEHAKIRRIIIHRIHRKEDNQDHGFAEYSDELFEFGKIEMTTLKNRVSNAFSRDKRFFKLEISQIGKGSFFDLAMTLKGCKDEEFISQSTKIADLLASSHDKKTIPSGLLLILQGEIDNKHFVLVIKAELQEAFTISEISKESKKEKIVEIIHDLFLSPAKDFYKMGYIIEDKTEGIYPNNEYACFMYDDNFVGAKRDLAEYFYSNFLGFTTSKNDKLLTKNFYSDVRHFIDEYVVGYDDKKGLRNALSTLLRENTSGIINPKEFGENNMPDSLLKIYYSKISSKYGYSFTKDSSLLDRKLTRGEIQLAKNLKIAGSAYDIENNVDIVEQPAELNEENLRKLKFSLESGEITQLILIKGEVKGDKM